MELTHGSLFSGIGGFDLASEWAGWENKFHCEINPFCRKVLKYYWPDAECYEDITKTDFTKWRGTIDVLSGGFPCQPFSAAGKRKGTADDRHLWPEMLRAIREIQPTWVVGENVPGIINWSRGLVVKQIKTDLEGAGFTVLPPVIIPACGKDACHQRYRVWIIAYSNSRVLEDVGVRPNKSLRICKDSSDKSDHRTFFHEFKEKTHGSLLHEFNGFPEKLDGITIPKWRTESLKGAGNAIVPQVAYEIFKVINLINQ